VRLAQGELGVGALLIIMLLGEAFRPLTDLERAYHGSYGARPACPHHPRRP
jgi:ABC-type transport system involved in cytochrome bd biosynthesis fused ATPase/permease subunit